MSTPWKQKASDDKPKFDVIPADSYAAVCVALIDLGTHTETVMDDKTKTEKQKDFRKILVAWELPGAEIDGKKNENHILAKDYNLSSHPKASLRKMIEAWRGKAYAENEEYDISKLLGQPCFITISHGMSQKGNAFPKIDAIVKLPTAIPKPAATQRKPFAWSVDEAEVPDLSWVPYLYGEKVESVIDRSHERDPKRKEVADHGEEPWGKGEEKELEPVPKGPDGEDAF